MVSAPPVTEVRKLRAVKWHVLASMLAAFFSHYTVFGPMMPLFLNSVGLDKARIGVVLSLLPFMNLGSVLVAPLVTRLGVKRLAIGCQVARSLLLVPLIFAPAVAARFGTSAAFLWVAGFIALFGLVRMLMETGIYAWTHEVVPNSMRGRFVALMISSNMGAGVVALLVGGWLLGDMDKQTGLQLLFGVGILFGFAYAAAMALIPGGRPIPAGHQSRAPLSGMRAVFADRNFMAYMAGTTVVTLAAGYGSFAPLYLANTLELSPKHVMMASMFGSLAWMGTAYLWGWSVDRFGTRPVMVSGIACAGLVILGWLFLPAGGRWILPAVYVLYFMPSALWAAYGTASSSYLYSEAVPSERRHEYMAVYCAWLALAGGLAPLLSGWFLQAFEGFAWRGRGLSLNAFTLHVLISGLCLMAAAWCFSRLRGQATVGAREFIGMLLHGNALVSVANTIRFRFAWYEGDRVSLTEQMGNLKARLNVEDVLEALADPAFNVRYEAVVSAARLPRNQKLTDALCAIVREQEPELSMTAAWALGRIGDPAALPALRGALKSDYRLLRARAARSLATMGDAESGPVLVAALREEPNDRLAVAFASALGSLAHVPAMPDVLALLGRVQQSVPRRELALAAARLAGREADFIRLWRASRNSMSAACAGALDALARRLREDGCAGRAFAETAAACASAWSEDNSERGTAMLCELAERFTAIEPEGPATTLLAESGRRLREFGARRPEYILLALHAMNIGVHRANTAGTISSVNGQARH